MRKYWFIIFFCSLLLQCGKNESTESKIETIIPQITSCAKLYTVQYNVHKILTYEDMQALEGTIFSEKFSIPIPGDRKLVIPIDACVKAYIDFSHFNKENFSISGNKLEVTLPDPKIVITSSKIDYKNEKQYISWNRTKFSSKEKEEFLQQGRASILASMAKSDIIDRCRTSAYHTLQPIFVSAGFNPEEITIHFRNTIENALHDEQTIKILSSIDD